MALPTSGPITFSMINTELGRPANQRLNLSDASIRQLAGALSGQVNLSMLRGKAVNNSLAEITLGAVSYVPTSGYEYVGFGSATYGSVSPTTLSGYAILTCSVMNYAGSYSVSFEVNTGGARPAWSYATKLVIGGVTFSGAFTVVTNTKTGISTIVFSVAITAAQFTTVRSAILNKSTVVKLLP